MSKVSDFFNKKFDEMVEEQNRDAEKNGDYFENGLLFCGKCHTAKQFIKDVDGEPKVRPIACKCEIEAMEAEDRRKREEERQRRVQAIKRNAFPDSNMETWTFDKDDGGSQKYTKIAKNYVANFDEMLRMGKGLLLFGDVGTGKTFLSACIANALMEKEYLCMVTNFSRIVNTLQGKFEGRQQYLDSFNKYDLLVLDDLAAERDTEYMNEMVMSVIDSRYRVGKPLIVTTNLTSNELRGATDISKQRIYSRLFEMCVPIEVKGVDRRKEKLKAEHEHMAELLGL